MTRCYYGQAINGYSRNNQRKYWTQVSQIFHRRAVAQPCVNGDRLSQGKMENSTPRRSEIPQLIDTKFETGDYVREATLCAKFRANPSIGGFSANG